MDLPKVEAVYRIEYIGQYVQKPCHLHIASPKVHIYENTYSIVPCCTLLLPLSFDLVKIRSAIDHSLSVWSSCLCFALSYPPPHIWLLWSLHLPNDAMFHSPGLCL